MEFLDLGRIHEPTAHGELIRLLLVIKELVQEVIVNSIPDEFINEGDNQFDFEWDTVADALFALWKIHGVSDQLDMLVARLKREQILLVGSVEPNDPSDEGVEYGYPGIRENTGIEDGRIIKKALEKLEIRTPSVGEKNYKLPRGKADMIKVMEHFSQHARSEESLKRASSWLQDNRNSASYNRNSGR